MPAANTNASASAKAPVMLGMQMPDTDAWSPLVTVALGQNPGGFTGPGTNTYLIGAGPQKLLLDTGEGRAEYLPVLKRAMSQCGCAKLQALVLTHGHPDHIGGAAQVLQEFGPLPVYKFPHAEFDAPHAGLQLQPLADGARVKTEGATLRALHTPGHAPDHLCFLLEEEHALFSGDNVLGVGTTVIPAQSGSLVQYMDSLRQLLRLAPRVIYPAHGPRIADGAAKIAEYIKHRNLREKQVQAQLKLGPRAPMEIVRAIYADYPEALHAAAAQSVTQHLLKLESEGAAARDAGAEPLRAIWRAA